MHNICYVFAVRILFVTSLTSRILDRIRLLSIILALLTYDSKLRLGFEMNETVQNTTQLLSRPARDLGKRYYPKFDSIIAAGCWSICAKF